MVCLASFLIPSGLTGFEASLQKSNRVKRGHREAASAERDWSGSSVSETRKIARRRSPMAILPRRFRFHPEKELSYRTNRKGTIPSPPRHRSKGRQTIRSPRSRSISSMDLLRTRRSIRHSTLQLGRMSALCFHDKRWKRSRKPKRKVAMSMPPRSRRSSLVSLSLSSSPKRRSSVSLWRKDRGERKTRMQRIGTRCSRSTIILKRRDGRLRTRSR